MPEGRILYPAKVKAIRQDPNFSLSYFTVSWLLLSEIFPAGIKGRAFSIATVLNWGTNLMVSLTFLDMLSKYFLDVPDFQILQ